MGNIAFRRETLPYDDVQICVRASSLRSELEKEALLARLNGRIETGADYLSIYATILTQTEGAEGIGFALPAPSADEETHQAAYELFVTLPSVLILNWFEACQRVNTPPGTVPVLHPNAVSADPKFDASETHSATG